MSRAIARPRVEEGAVIARKHGGRRGRRSRSLVANLMTHVEATGRIITSNFERMIELLAAQERRLRELEESMRRGGPKA
jgi:hypothetical protein